MKKYKLTDETIQVSGRTLFRVQAIISFGTITKDTKGGFIEKEQNLSHSGEAWVYGEARVYGKAQVTCHVVNLIAVCEYNVTAYCNFVQIGCKLHKISEWKQIFKAGTYMELCHNDISYLQCKAAFEFCVFVIESRKEI